MESRPLEATSSPTSPLASLDFTRIVQIIFRRFWLIVLCLALTVGAGVFYILRTPKAYTATTTVQVEQVIRRPVSLRADDAIDEDNRAADILKTFEQTLSTGTLLLRVARANHLPDRRDFQPTIPGSPPLSDAEIAIRMWSKVSVKLRPGTRLIDIGVDDIDPVMTCQLARSVVEEYAKQSFEQSVEVSRGTNQFLQSEEQRLKDDVEAAETALALYRAQNQAVSLDKAQNIVVDKLKEINQQVTEAKGRRLALEADVNKIQAVGTADPEQLLSLASVTAVPEVVDLRRQINEKEGEFAAIKQRYLYKHIKYIEAESALKKLRAALNAEVLSAADQVTRTYQGLQATEDKLGVALREQEQRALQLDSTAIPYAALQRQVDSSRALYESVLARQKETAMSQINPYDLRVVEKPVVPTRPSKPARLKILAAAAAAGLLLSLAIIFGLELFNHTLQTVDQAEQALGLPLLAAVPERKGLRQGIAGAKGIAVEAPQREAFRTLRTTLAAIPRQSEARSFLFTSAVPDEGKSFCSLNYAVSLASQGIHTLLINADLRRIYPYDRTLQHKGTVGLSECLASTVPLAQAVWPTETQNLFFCPAGKRIDSPANLLTGERFAEILRAALLVFDRVVIDTPPINAVSDCLVIAPRVDAVCLVVRALSTPIKAVWRAGRLLTMAHVVPTGFVLNRLPSGFGAKYTHYYYGDAYFREERRRERTLAEERSAENRK